MSVEFVGIELELRGEEAVYRDLQKIDTTLNSLRGKKKIDAGLTQLKRDIVAVEGELQKWQRLQKGVDKGSAEWTEYGQKINETKSRLQDLQRTQKEVTLASRQMGDTFKQTFNNISSRVAHIGSAMQSLGNAMTRLTSPLNRVTTGLLYGVGYKALNMLTSGLSGATQRADIMSTYRPIMTALAGDVSDTNALSKQLEGSLERLNEAVLGLPTGLDEIVDMHKQLTIATNDISKAEQLAIASNNAYLAGGADEAIITQGKRMLQTLATTGELTAKQWNSLRKAIPVTWNEMQAEIDKDLSKLSADEFMNLLIDKGIDGKTKEVILEMLHTYNAATANIENAFRRMGQNILSTLDDVLLKTTGKDTIDYLIDFKNAINDVSQSIQDWIRANPDKITDFINGLKSIDFKGLLAGIGEGMLDMLKIVQNVAKLIGGDNLRGFGKFLVRLNLMGKALTITGGLLKGSRHIIGGIGATIIRGVRSFKGRGILGMFGDLIAGESIYNMDKTTAKLDKAIPATGKLSKIFTGWTKVATMIGGSAFVAWGSLKLFKGAFQSIKEIGDIVGDTDWGKAGKALAGMGGFITAMTALAKFGKFGKGALISGGVLAGLTLLFSGTFWADMVMIKRGLQAMSDAVGLVNGIIDEVNNIKDAGGINTDKLDNAIQAFNKITKLFSGEMEATGGEGSVSTGQYSNARGSFKNKKDPLLMFKKEYTDSLNNLKEALGYIKDISDLLDEVNGLTFDTDNVQDVTDRINAALGFIGKTVEKIPEVFTKQKTETTTGILKQSMEDIKNAFNYIVGEGGLFSEIEALNEQMTKLVKAGAFTTLQTNMDTLSTNLSQIWSKLNFASTDGSEGFDPQGKFGGGGFNKSGGTAQLTNPTEMILTQLQNLSQAMIEVQGIIETINSISTAEIDLSGIDTISEAITRLKTAFGEEIVGGLVEQINSFVETINTALDQLRSFEEEIAINVTVKLADAFQTSVDDVVNKIKEGKDTIREQRTAVRFSIPVHVTFSLSTNLGSVLSSISTQKAQIKSAGGGSGGGWSTGGMIYRAKGGNIPFGKRRGTDTVPAMLTPGEYVHNKRAVDYFGQDFMSKINRLDVRGALADLMMKAGNVASAGAATVINNYNYDNRNVTINNDGAVGAGFTFKQAGRALQAL